MFNIIYNLSYHIPLPILFQKRRQSGVFPPPTPPIWNCCCLRRDAAGTVLLGTAHLQSAWCAILYEGSISFVFTSRKSTVWNVTFLPSKFYFETDVERALRRFHLQCFILKKKKKLANCMPMTRATKLGLWSSRVNLCGKHFLVSFLQGKLRFLGQNFFSPPQFWSIDLINPAVIRVQFMICVFICAFMILADIQ